MTKMAKNGESHAKTIEDWKVILNKRPQVLEILSPPYKEIVTALFQNQTNNPIK